MDNEFDPTFELNQISLLLVYVAFCMATTLEVGLKLYQS